MSFLLAIFYTFICLPVCVAIFTVVLVALKEARVVVTVCIWAAVVDLEIAIFIIIIGVVGVVWWSSSQIGLVTYIYSYTIYTRSS